MKSWKGKRAVFFLSITLTVSCQQPSVFSFFSNCITLPTKFSNVTIGHSWCQDAGIYEFTMGTTGDKVKGRYSFVYVREDGQWKISHHHSSVMPEAFLGPAPKPVVAAAIPL